MDQNSYITIEMSCRIQMLCGARHNICYVRRWIMWTVLIIKLISALWHAIAPHNPSNIIKPSEQIIIHRQPACFVVGSDPLKS